MLDSCCVYGTSLVIVLAGLITYTSLMSWSNNLMSKKEQGFNSICLLNYSIVLLDGLFYRIDTVIKICESENMLNQR